MAKKKIYIIGSGIAGLTIGSYLQINGYDTQIFEIHDISGGLCTSWHRKGYNFDGCIHSTATPENKYKLNKWFSELIDFGRLEYHYYDDLGKIVFKDGMEFTFYTDPEKLGIELSRIAPEDNKFIKAFIRGIKVLSKYDIQISKPVELWNPLDYYLSQFKIIPYISCLSKWSKSLETCVKDCKSSILKKTINQDFFSRYPAYFFLISIGQMHNKKAGYPIGGSLKFAGLLEKKYIELGGKINFKSKVDKILEKDNNAYGIKLRNEQIFDNADIIISAADGYDTIFNMLEGKFTDKKISGRYKSHPKWPSVVLVSLGVAGDFKNVPSSVELHLAGEFIIDDNTKTDIMHITIYNFDPTLAPDGKTFIRVILHTYNFKYWNDLKQQNISNYKLEKERIGNEVVNILDNYLGNIKNNLEAFDVATPATFNRYTNNWDGSIQGWQWLPGLIPEHIKSSLPKLKNFYMTGQWVMPGGGISGAFINARDLARIICAKDSKKFKNS